jgi:hypothetical protein
MPIACGRPSGRTVTITKLCDLVSLSRAQLQSSKPLDDFETPYPGITGRLGTTLQFETALLGDFVFLVEDLTVAGFFGIRRLKLSPPPIVKQQRLLVHKRNNSPKRPLSA